MLYQEGAIWYSIGWGCTINPYDLCIANKTITKRQCTIKWHVDDLKILHVENDVVENIIKSLIKNLDCSGIPKYMGKKP